jgi:putative DNA-invertase from lambdoid prophage Rac
LLIEIYKVGLIAGFLAKRKTYPLVADFERGLIRERTLAGQAKAWQAGKTKGRPSKTTKSQRITILAKLNSGISVSQVAREFKVSRASIINIRESHQN